MSQEPSSKPRQKSPRRGLDKDLVRLPRRGGVLAVLVGAFFIGLGAGARVLLEDLAGGAIPYFITFYPLLGLVGFLCGSRLGVAATIASALLVWYLWMAPLQSWDIPDQASVAGLVIYSVLGSLTAWIGAWARGLFDKVQATRMEHDRVARETVHRLKNLIAVIQGLSHQTARSAATVADYKADLDARLIALGKAQELLLDGGRAKITAARLVEAVAGAYRDSPHFEVSGDGDFLVPQPIHLGLALALGELGANSLKYGALAGKGGKVHLTLSQARGRRIILWREEASLSSDRKGFGSRLISSALDRLPNARVDYAADPDGIHCSFEWAEE